MNTTEFTRTSWVYGLAAVIGMAFMPADGALAQENCNIERDIKVAGFKNETTYNRLQKVYDDISEENWAKAGQELNNLLNRSKEPYELAVIHQALAQVEWAQERFDASLRNFEKAVELNSLPNSTHFSLMYQIAQLYYTNERYDEALDRLDKWLCQAPEDKIDSNVFVLQASIYAQKQDYRRALTSIDKAIGMSDSPKEQWYQLKLAMQFELERYPQAAETLEIMITNWPDNKTYWKQLTSIYLKLKQDSKALATMALVYRRGMLETEAEWKQLVTLYQTEDIPFKAGRVMEEGISKGVISGTAKNYEQLANVWYAAEELEKSLEAYERAGSASNNGEIDLRRGYILVDMERWQDAKAALTDAINKGGLSESERADAWLLKGMAGVELGQYGQAQQDLNRAMQFGKTRQAAQQYLNYMQEKQAAQQAS